jgi:hypothetical protein
VKARFAGFEAGQQLEFQPLDQRVLQQDLLLTPQILDIVRWLGAAGEARAEIFRIEVVGSGDIDIADPAFDDAKSNHAVNDILVRDQHARVDVAAIDVEQRQLAADFFEIRRAHRLAEVVIDNAADRRFVEDGVAEDPHIAKNEARALPQRRALGGLRRHRDDYASSKASQRHAANPATAQQCQSLLSRPPPAPLVDARPGRPTPSFSIPG